MTLKTEAMVQLVSHCYTSTGKLNAEYKGDAEARKNKVIAAPPHPRSMISYVHPIANFVGPIHHTWTQHHVPGPCLLQLMFIALLAFRFPPFGGHL